MRLKLAAELPAGDSPIPGQPQKRQKVKGNGSTITAKLTRDWPIGSPNATFSGACAAASNKQPAAAATGRFVGGSGRAASPSFDFHCSSLSKTLRPFPRSPTQQYDSTNFNPDGRSHHARINNQSSNTTILPRARTTTTDRSIRATDDVWEEKHGIARVAAQVRLLPL